MATLKPKDIRAMNAEDKAKKLKELEFELIKTRANPTKGGSGKTKAIKKIIARLHTLK